MKRLALCVVLAACQQTRVQPTAGSGSDVSTPASSPVPAATPAAAPAAPPPDKPSRPVPPLPSPLPGKHSELPFAAGASKLAIGDLDGDGTRELVLADANTLRVVTRQGKQLASVPAPGGCQALVVTDVGGKPAILAGWGLSREHRDAAAKIVRYRLEGGKLVEDTVVAPETTRAEVVAIVPGASDVLVAYYTSKYMVKSAYAHLAGSAWQLAPIAELRMATSYARGDVDGDGKPELVVGRVYGDAKGVDGDAFVLAPNGAKTPIPTTRGVHGLAIADGALWLGDGWHQNYANEARGLVTRVTHDASGFHAQLIEDTPGQFMIEKIVPVKIDGKTTIVTLGSHYVRAYREIDGKWTGLTIAGAARDLALDGDDIIVVGDKSEVIDLRGAAWK